MPFVSLLITLPSVIARRSIEAVKIRSGSSRLIPFVAVIVGMPPSLKSGPSFAVNFQKVDVEQQELKVAWVVEGR